MPKPRIISAAQFSKLLSLMDSNKEIANNRLVGGPLGHQRVAQFWAHVAVSLNSVADGATKDADQWKKYWQELKYRAKKRASQIRQHASGTGGGPSIKPLTETETKILDIMGSVAYEGNPNAQIPIEIPDPLHPVQAEAYHNDSMLVLPWEEEQEESYLRDVEQETSTSREMDQEASPLREVEVEPVPSTSREREVDTSQAGRAQTSITSRVRRSPYHRTQNQTRVRHIDDDVPAWARDYEERRLALEERRLALDEQRLELEQRNSATLVQLLHVLTTISQALEKV